MYLFINLKAYKQGTGENANSLVKSIKTIDTGSLNIQIAAQPTDIFLLSNSGFEIWAQHIDEAEEGPKTGWITASAVALAGAKGVFLNHSEHKFNTYESLSVAHKNAKGQGLKTLVFAQDEVEFEKILNLKPDFICYEPPELVGNTQVSVATAKQDIISKVFLLSKSANIPLIVGAGIHSSQDIKVSIELGAVGVAVATNIVKANDPGKALQELIVGFQKQI